ncbi:MAG TPA: cytochrome-c oxidase, cbb3-type subunit II [Candidatus Dormibacteraeota bacterium]|nr:cytochrome-c oxidase, cbb3-type subunit II [Candidatus Dormibacteraeota bacterium]
MAAVEQPLVERNIGIMGILIFIVVSFAGLAEIVPLLAGTQVTEPIEGVQPLEPLALEGRDIYIRDGCHVCHTQMIRPLRAEVERYGHYSVAGESVYDHPFLFGSKRTGPDLARVGGRYSDEWHRIHLLNPRDLVPESNMPPFPWLATNTVDADHTADKMRALRIVGVPYTDEQIAGAKSVVEGHTEMEALIAYLQQLGLALKGRQ